jgi:hypothetical protein
LERVLRTCIDSTQQDWTTHLPPAVFALNSAVSSAHGFSPFELVYGQTANVPVTAMFGLPTNKSIRMTGYGRLMEERFARVYEAARENLGLTFRQTAAQYIKLEPEPINIGDEVFFFTPVVKKGGVRKLNLFWTGPWQVMKKKGILYNLIPSGDW